MSAQSPEISQQILEQGMALHRAGHLGQAEAIYRQILAQYPDHPGTLNLLGLIAHQVGRNETAVQLIGRAISLTPGAGDFYANLSLALLALGKTKEAIEACRHGLQILPDSPELNNNLGNALARQPGGLAQAILSFRRSIEIRPGNAEAYNNLGSALSDNEEIDQAIDAFRQAARIRPDFAEAHHNLANTLYDSGRVEESIQPYEITTRLRPTSAEAWNNFANALNDLRQMEPALSAFEKALQLDPNRAEIWSNLGNMFKDWGRRDQAVSAFRRAIALQPDLPEAHNNLGATLNEMGKLDEATAEFEGAITLRPTYGEAINNLASIYEDLSLPDKAIEFYHRAVAADPNFSKPHNNLGNVLGVTGRTTEALAEYRKAMAINPGDADAASNYVYTLHYDPDVTPKKILDEQTKWDERHARPLAKFIKRHLNVRDPNRRLKIGYVSADFRRHVVASNLLPILMQHAHDGFEIFCYSNVGTPDNTTAKIKALADVWRDVATMSDQQIDQLIRQDQIDILIDLSMHSANNLLQVFARKPAPIQLTYLGYCGATSLSAMDYRLSDPYLDSEETEANYREKTLYLSHSYWCYGPGGDAPEPTSDLPSEESGHITFGCMNNFAKVSLPAQKLWAEILKQVNDSRLLVHAQPGKHRDEFKARFAEWGVDAGRIEFIPKQPWDPYIQTYARMDIALDPFPYNGGITTCDALWMGVPVVTLVGETSVGRAGKSILSNVGLPELIAQSSAEYVDIAVGLTGDPSRLKKIRGELRAKMRQSPLMNAGQFTIELESILRQIWKTWCAGD